MSARPVQVRDSSAVWREFPTLGHAITAWKSAPIGTSVPKRTTMQARLARAGPEGVVRYHHWEWRYAPDPEQIVLQEPRGELAQDDLASGIVDALRGEDGGVITTIRSSDGFINATKLCQAKGKFFANYMENNKTRDFLEEMREQYKIGSNGTSISGHIGNPISPANSAHSWKTPIFLVESLTTGGSWVHPDIAVNLAQWCSPIFAVMVSRLIWRYLSGGVTTEESVRASEAVVEAMSVASVPSTSGESSLAIVDPRLPPGFELLSDDEKRGFARKFAEEYVCEKATQRCEKAMDRYKEFEKMEAFNDPRIMSRMRDVVVNSACGLTPLIENGEAETWETISSWLTNNNKHDRYQAIGFTSKMGRIAARLFRQENEDRAPRKIKKIVNGEMRPVNVYADGDELLKRAFDQAVEELA